MFTALGSISDHNGMQNVQRTEALLKIPILSSDDNPEECTWFKFLNRFFPLDNMKMIPTYANLNMDGATFNVPKDSQ